MLVLQFSSGCCDEDFSLLQRFTVSTPFMSNLIIQTAVGLLPGLSFSVAALVLGERLASFHYEHLACFVLSMCHVLAILRDEIERYSET